MGTSYYHRLARNFYTSTSLQCWVAKSKSYALRLSHSDSHFAMARTHTHIIYTRTYMLVYTHSIKKIALNIYRLHEHKKNNDFITFTACYCPLACVTLKNG